MLGFAPDLLRILCNARIRSQLDIISVITLLGIAPLAKVGSPEGVPKVHQTDEASESSPRPSAEDDALTFGLPRAPRRSTKD